VLVWHVQLVVVRVLVLDVVQFELLDVPLVVVQFELLDVPLVWVQVVVLDVPLVVVLVVVRVSLANG
jgi:hypothetical protein